MNPKNRSMLSEIIINKIKSEGPISFHDFMELSLYHPQFGYYTSAADKIGLKGDYFTSSTLTPLFGMLIGRQLEQMWELLEKNPFTIVEYGAGTGALCNAILSALKMNEKFYHDLNYCIIEKSGAMREKEKSFLNEKVTWHDSTETVAPVNGCILSNEVVDNFAVHRVVMQENLMEIFVDYRNGFVEILQPASDELKLYLDELRVKLPTGFRTEINLQATRWIKDVAGMLEKGFVLTIDYGDPSFELYSEYRNSGTLMCYNKNGINGFPYSHIGEQDITSHVNFSALCLWGFKNGLNFCGFTNQCNFLSALGFYDCLKKNEIPGQDYHNLKKEIFLTQTLMKDMGHQFKVLIQEKGIPGKKLLGIRS
jgi:SAM-dependent MidA family methyltransferase